MGQEYTIMESTTSSLFIRLLRQRSTRFAMLMILAVILMAVLAPVLSPQSPYRQDLYHVLQKPSKTHWLGTDNLGRDLFSRIVYGSRISLYVGIVSTLFSAMVGILLGLLAGYWGGMIDEILMRVTDAFMCFPFLIFVLALAAALGPGVNNVIISLSFLGWTGFARLTRSQVLVVRELPYVEAARAIGMPEWRIVFSHVIPNSISPLVVAISLFVGRAILTESGSAFLGLGAEPPLASWGKELRAGFTYLERSPLLSAVPGFMITLVVSAFNFLGDGLRDAIDPHMRGEG